MINEEIKSKNDVTAIFLLFIGLIIMLICFVVIQLIFINVLGVTDLYFISGYWVFSIIPIIFYFSYLQNKGYVSFRDVGLTRKHILKSIWLGLIAGFSTGIIGLILLSIFTYPVSKPTSSLLFIFTFSSIVSAPIREEIMFRGIFWAFLDKSTMLILKNRKRENMKFKKDIIVILVISFAFLYVHIGREVELLLTKFLIDSFIFSIIYYKTKNITAPILAHSISNMFVLLLPFL